MPPRRARASQLLRRTLSTRSAVEASAVPQLAAFRHYATAASAPPHRRLLRDLATRLFKEIALTAEPSKSQLEATLIEFIGQTLFMVDRWKTERPQ